MNCPLDFRPTQKMIDAGSRAGARKDDENEWMPLNPYTASDVIVAAIKADPQRAITIANIVLTEIKEKE